MNFCYNFYYVCVTIFSPVGFPPLQANDGNVEISSQGLMDAVGLKLLSTQRKFENVANYRSSSSH